MMNLGALLGTCLVWFVTLLLRFSKVVYTHSWQWWWQASLPPHTKPWRLYTNFHGVSNFNLVSKLYLLPQMPSHMLERFNKKKKKMKFISWYLSKVGLQAHITKNKLHGMSLLCRVPMNVALMLEYNRIMLQFMTRSGSMDMKVLWYASFWQIPTQTKIIIMITKVERSETTTEPKIVTMYYVHTFENKCMHVCMWYIVMVLGLVVVLGMHTLET